MKKGTLILSYLKQRRLFFVMEAAFCVVFLCSFLLYRLPPGAVLYPTLLCVILGGCFLLYGFREELKKHQKLRQIRSMIDVIETKLPKAGGMGEADYQEIIRLLREEHSRYSNLTNQEYADMIDYYTVWVHQIKTPIASMRLTLQNEDTQAARRIQTDLHRIEQYVEMVLTFLRLNSESSDYVIREVELDDVVSQAVKKFSQEFIGRRLSLSYEPLEKRVLTDEKWLSFVVEQVLSNALKYTRTGGISITMTSDGRLSIRDTGIGIAPEDLPRIFENGYTGFNGRGDKKASGIGLYLCKRICNNLGHDIRVASVLDQGTEVTLTLSRQSLEVE